MDTKLTGILHLQRGDKKINDPVLQLGDGGPTPGQNESMGQSDEVRFAADEFSSVARLYTVVGDVIRV